MLHGTRTKARAAPARRRALARSHPTPTIGFWIIAHDTRGRSSPSSTADMAARRYYDVVVAPPMAAEALRSLPAARGLPNAARRRRLQVVEAPPPAAGPVEQRGAMGHSATPSSRLVFGDVKRHCARISRRCWMRTPRAQRLRRRRARLLLRLRRHSTSTSSTSLRSSGNGIGGGPGIVFSCAARRRASLRAVDRTDYGHRARKSGTADKELRGLPQAGTRRFRRPQVGASGGATGSRASCAPFTSTTAPQERLVRPAPRRGLPRLSRKYGGE